VIKHDKIETNDREVEKEAPRRMLIFQTEFVLAAHDTDCDEIGEDYTAEDHKDVLRNESPWRVTGSKERGLAQSVTWLIVEVNWQSPKR
jgi:hypothetical protein